MAFKMAGFSAFTKKHDKDYEPQTKAGGREYEDMVRRSDLDEEGKKIFDSKGYEPQSTRIYLDDKYEVVIAQAKTTLKLNLSLRVIKLKIILNLVLETILM